jgi:outer membrane protein
MKQGIKLAAFSILTGAMLALSSAAGPRETGGIAGKRLLSLDEALNTGLSFSPGLHASEMSIEASRARTKELAATRLPAVKLGAGYTRLSEVPPFEINLPFSINGVSSFTVSPYYFNNYSLKASLQQPLFTGFKLESAQASARFMEDSAARTYGKDRSDYVYRIKSSYWNLVRARRAAAVVAEAKRQVEEHLKDVRSFFDQGLLTRNDVLKAEVRLANIELQEVEEANAEAMAEAALNSLIGLALGTSLEPTTPPEAAAADIDWDKVIGSGAAAGTPALVADEDLSGQPEVGAFRFRIKAGEAGLKTARSGYFPQIYLTANYYYMRPNPRYMPNRDRFDDTWDVGVTMSFDLWNWGQTKQQVKQARAALAQARDAARLSEDRVRLEITDSRLAVAAARSRLAAAEKTVGLTDENLRTIRERFKEGVALNTDVLDAETEYLQAGLARTQAAADLAVALAAYEKAMGR